MTMKSKRMRDEDELDDDELEDELDEDELECCIRGKTSKWESVNFAA